MLVGVIYATQLSWWQANGPILETLSFGAIKSEGISSLIYDRLRPLHTNAVIFAFVGNMAFLGIYDSTQRLCNYRTASDKLSLIHFWGWRSIIVGAGITLRLGLTQSKKYAELIPSSNSSLPVSSKVSCSANSTDKAPATSMSSSMTSSSPCVEPQETSPISKAEATPSTSPSATSSPIGITSRSKTSLWC